MLSIRVVLFTTIGSSMCTFTLSFSVFLTIACAYRCHHSGNKNGDSKNIDNTLACDSHTENSSPLYQDIIIGSTEQQREQMCTLELNENISYHTISRGIALK